MTPDARMATLFDALGPAVGGVVASTFAAMEVAEREIARAKRRYPKRRSRIDAAFLLLRPTPALQGRERAYPRHARELLRRVARGQDTRPATDAEVVCAMLEVSLAAPLKHEPAVVCDALFRRVVPEADLGPRLGKMGPYEEEVLETWRSRLRQDWRRLPKEKKG